MKKSMAIVALLLTVAFMWLICIMPKSEPMYIAPMSALLIALGISFYEVFEK